MCHSPYSRQEVHPVACVSARPRGSGPHNICHRRCQVTPGSSWRTEWLIGAAQHIVGNCLELEAAPHPPITMPNSFILLCYQAGPTHPFYITDSIIGGASNPNETIYAGNDSSYGTAMKPYVLAWTPPASAPDTLYYQCHTHQKLGWKIQLEDKQTPSALTDSQTRAPAKSAAFYNSLNRMMKWSPLLLVAALVMI